MIEYRNIELSKIIYWKIFLFKSVLIAKNIKFCVWFFEHLDPLIDYRRKGNDLAYSCAVMALRPNNGVKYTFENNNNLLK